MGSNFFMSRGKIEGFDIKMRTIVDQEKEIDSYFKSAFSSARISLDLLHVKKNMSAVLGKEQLTGLYYYEIDLRAPSQSRCSILKSQYCFKRSLYVNRFGNHKRYISHSYLQYLMYSSQDAKSFNSSFLRNHVRVVEPQQMLHLYVLHKRFSFLKHKRNTMSCTFSVPPAIENNI